MSTNMLVSRLSQKERRHVVETLLLCNTYSAAKRLGVPYDTIRELMTDPDLCMDIVRERKRLIETTTNLLIKGRNLAVKKYIKWLRDDKMAMAHRLEAADKLLHQGTNYLEKQEVTNRLLELERILKEQAGV